MPHIVVLPESVANRIAAGEVVERPASALKELIENAIDARARRLEIVLVGGGRDSIVVTDDGEGMAPDDILLALERHATSKIRTDGDIEEVRTLGFRGEAIPSIASVCRFRMTSRDRASDAATSVEVHGGRLMGVKQEAGPPGSRIEVMGLFYNAPARRKFLRSPETERHKSIEVVSRFAIGYPEIRFTLVADGRTVFDYAAVSDPIERCAQVLGRPLASRLLRVESASAGMRLSGLASALTETRSHARDQHLYVNRRPVRDRLLAHAVSMAYSEALPRGRHPLLVLLLDLPHALVDVNVHPSKSEVRFRRSSEVHQFVSVSLQAALRRDTAFPSIGIRPAFSGELPVGPGESQGPVPEEFVADARAVGAGLGLPMDRPRHGPGIGGEPAPRYGAHPAGAPFLSRLPGTEGYTYSSAAVGGAAARALAGASPWTFSEGAPQADLAGPLVPLGQFLDSYILARGSDTLMIVDQHVAHERVLFEKLLRSRGAGPPPMQRLLTPVPVTVSAAAGDAARHGAPALAAAGFEIEEFGAETLLIRALPAAFEGADPERLLGEVLSDLAGQNRPAAPEDLRRRLAASAACHAAIKVHFPLTVEKMAWLLGELARCETPTTCPHGRPIVLRIGREEIERGFHRR